MMPPGFTTVVIVVCVVAIVLVWIVAIGDKGK